MLSAFGVEHDISKADKKHLAEVGAGATAVTGAANLNRLLDSSAKKIDAATEAHTSYRKRRVEQLKQTKNSPARIKLVRQQYGKINQLNAVANKAKKFPGYRGRVGTGAAGFIGGTALAWHGARELAKDRVAKKVTEHDVDAAFAGASGGAGGYQLGMYATKPYDRRQEKKIKTLSDQMDPKDETSPRARIYAHQKKTGITRNLPAGDPKWHKYFRTYPKGVPGWKFKRTMSYAHAGKTGVAATLGAGAAGAAASVAAQRKKNDVSKRKPGKLIRLLRLADSPKRRGQVTLLSLAARRA